MTISLWRPGTMYRGVKRVSRRFVSDVRGAVLFYLTATLPVIMGFSLLAIDASRLMTLHTTLQKGVDALALAGAGELDRAPGAMTRAQVAIAELVRNNQLFGDPGQPQQIDENNVRVRFYSAIPANDWDPMPDSGNTLLDATDPADDPFARFVEVTIDTCPQDQNNLCNYQMNSILPASWLGGNNLAATTATAVAGQDQVVCKIVPLFICNPWEPDGVSIYDNTSVYENTDTRTERRRQIRLRMGPGGSGWGAGNYGFLDFGNGATALEKALAVGSPENCFAQSGVTTEPGQTTGPVEDGMNTRFAIYPQSMANIGINSPDSNWQVRPAKNVRMGQNQAPGPGNNVCRDYVPNTVTSNGMALPRDPVFADPNARVGTSAHPLATEMEGYFDANFPNYGGWASAPTPQTVAPEIPAPDYREEPAADSWAKVTRWDIYKWERDTAMKAEVATGGEVGEPRDPPGPPQPGGARCWKGDDLINDTVERRVVGVAVVNCKALIAAGENLNGKSTGIPVATFSEFFLVEPLEKGGSGTAGDIYAEFVRVIEPGNQNSVVRNQVQIYR